MVAVSESITVGRPPAAVFAYLDQPEHHAVVTPSLAESKPVETLDNGGKRVRYVYRMAGISREGQLTETVHEAGRRMCFEMSGGITGEIDITLEPVEEGTEVTYSATYDLPGRVVAAVTKPLVGRFNRRQLQETLRNLKTELEADPATA
ncbi:MAG: carbon monoxide dehydrogenase subunit G [Halovenus sp.]|jgi:carbon monoxide dehydrogenase subunit G